MKLQVVINSDRVHICTSGGIPQETHLFKTFAEWNNDEEARKLAIGHAVTRALQLWGDKVDVIDKSK